MKAAETFCRFRIYIAGYLTPKSLSMRRGLPVASQPRRAVYGESGEVGLHACPAKSGDVNGVRLLSCTYQLNSDINYTP